MDLTSSLIRKVNESRMQYIWKKFYYIQIKNENLKVFNYLLVPVLTVIWPWNVDLKFYVYTSHNRSVEIKEL